MSKTTSVVAWLVVVGGLLLLAALPVGRLLLLYARLGLPALTLLMFAEAAIGVARSVSPVRGTAWWKRGDLETPGFTNKVIGLELGVSAFAVALVAGTAPWWQPHLGFTVPLWLLGVIGLRHAFNSAALMLGVLVRPFAGILGLFDLMIGVPLFALITGSVAGAMIGAMIMSLVVMALATRLPTKADLEKATGKKWSDSKDDRDTPDRWRVGAYINQLAGNVRRPLLVAVAGVAALVPYSACVMLASLLALPFVAAAMHPDRPESNVLRVTLGTVLAGLAFLVIRELGPTIYLAIYPAAFGNGAWLEVFAWGALAIIPASLQREKTSGQMRVAFGGIAYGALLVGLTITHGLPGLIVGASLGLAVSTLVGARCKTSDPLISE